MEPANRIFISHQQQCDPSEVEKLIDYLINVGFEVEHGNFTETEFNAILPKVESYVCVLDNTSYQSKDLAREIITAAKNGKKVFAIYCPTLSGEIQLPPTLNTCAAGVTEWDLEKLAKGLNGKDVGFSDRQGNQKQNSRSTKTPGCK